MNPKGKGFSEDFDWGLYPQTERFLEKEIARWVQRHPRGRALAQKMKKQSSTRVFDWVDHVVLPASRASHEKLLKLGYVHLPIEDVEHGMKVFRHPHSIFFPVLTHEKDETILAVKVDSIQDFVRAQKFRVRVQGKPFSPLRRMRVEGKRGFFLEGIERRGTNGFVIRDVGDVKTYKAALRAFAKRKRAFSNDQAGMRGTHKLIQAWKKKLNPGRIADAFFRGERDYWLSRNRAGKIQKARQDLLGMGWGNHDHHTYRASRAHFAHLIRMFEDLGFVPREQFFAGKNAGWGAQILEHPECDIVVFADVDILPAEKKWDFAHRGLKDVKKLGTVGLWVGLHGESVLQAGMHHLEARFLFDSLRKDLAKKKVGMMAPFSSFAFLKQAFTVPDLWKVEKKRLDGLKRKGKITAQQYEQFRSRGALGSHMENLQRRQGFKGFNQDSVSVIIKATDPRNQAHRGA